MRARNAKDKKSERTCPKEKKTSFLRQIGKRVLISSKKHVRLNNNNNSNNNTSMRTRNFSQKLD